jgi:hypothetical protein
MKRVILFLVMLVISLTSFSQLVEVEFKVFIDFNAGATRDYKKLIDTSSYVVYDENFGGLNKYIFDFDNKIAKRYFNGILDESSPIIEFTKKGNLYFLKISDVELLTGKTVISNVVLNTLKTDKLNPKFLMYFISTRTNTTNGSVVFH